jgi:uncharacterized protein YdcH (DUF465 family)
MAKVQAESVHARLMETNEEFRRLAEQHTHYDRRIEELASRRFPSPEEQFEEARLKKLKLHLKDQMHQIVESFEQQAAT